MTLPGIFTTIVIEELAGLRWSQRCRWEVGGPARSRRSYAARI